MTAYAVPLNKPFVVNSKQKIHKTISKEELAKIKEIQDFMRKYKVTKPDGSIVYRF